MRWRRRIEAGGDEEHTGLGHSAEERPWVFAMIDCFMLIVNFLIVTFAFRADEWALEQKLGPGGEFRRCTPTAYTLHVKVLRGRPEAVYEFLTRKASLEDFASVLVDLKTTKPDFCVRVSYEGAAEWRHVMAVFNECRRVGIRDCGLMPLRIPAGRS
jgi:biopolymer transport protein ExbD